LLKPGESLEAVQKQIKTFVIKILNKKEEEKLGLEKNRKNEENYDRKIDMTKRKKTTMTERKERKKKI